MAGVGESAAGGQDVPESASVDERFVAQLRAVLPQLLRERPEIAAEIEIQLRQVFATKDDVRALLEAMDRRQAQWNERFDRQQAEWKAQQAQWNERHDRQERSLLRRLDGLGSRWGLQAEQGFREGLAALLREAVGQRVERWEGFDASGQVYGWPSSVEIDVAIADGDCTLVEVKSSAGAADVREFARVAEFYERTERAGQRSRRLIVTAWADERAHAEARVLGVEICSGS
ncbi:MAG: DUF3782 domain-containing protein [Deltaproteobacteria bacterium]|nr:DUF3782 domain-containing protein [Deltaproteobacteria bacterium]